MMQRHILLWFVIGMLLCGIVSADSQMTVVNMGKTIKPSLNQNDGTGSSTTGSGSDSPNICKATMYIGNKDLGLSVKKGDTFQVPIFIQSGEDWLTCNENIGNIEFEVVYNLNDVVGVDAPAINSPWKNFPFRCKSYKPALKLISVEPGSLVQNSLFDYNTGKKTYSHVSNSGCNDVDADSVAVAIVSNSGFTGYGTLAVLNFEVEDENLGKTDRPCIDIDYLHTSFTANTVTGTKVAIWNPTVGYVCWEEPVKGDGNGDGRITSEDAYLALQMALGKIPEDLILDMDNDGKVTTNDARILLTMAQDSENAAGPATSNSAVQESIQTGQSANQLSPENGKVIQNAASNQKIVSDKERRGATPIQLP